MPAVGTYISLVPLSHAHGGREYDDIGVLRLFAERRVVPNDIRTAAPGGGGPIEQQSNSQSKDLCPRPHHGSAGVDATRGTYRQQVVVLVAWQQSVEA